MMTFLLPTSILFLSAYSKMYVSPSASLPAACAASADQHLPGYCSIGTLRNSSLISFEHWFSSSPCWLQLLFGHFCCALSFSARDHTSHKELRLYSWSGSQQDCCCLPPWLLEPCSWLIFNRLPVRGEFQRTVVLFYPWSRCLFYRFFRSRTIPVCDRVQSVW